MNLADTVKYTRCHANLHRIPKKKYIRKSDADKAIKTIDTFKDTSGMQSYFCKSCGFFHIGHSKEYYALERLAGNG